jgi:N-carbamoylputrescine amidase
LAEAPAAEATTLLVDVDLRRSEDVRRIWPFLRDRRVDAYQNIVSRFID